MRHRVVITGVGAVTPLGVGADALWEGILAGRSGIRRISRFDPSPFPSQIAGEVPGFDPTAFIDRKEARRMDRFTQFAMATVAMALRDAGLDPASLDGDRLGVVMGTGIGGIETFVEQAAVMAERGPDRVSPFFIPMMIANMAAGQVAIRYGARGPNTTVVTACAASAHAIGEAFRILQRGQADVMITGGSEAAIVPLGLAGFCAMKALSTRNDRPEAASRPFDRGRDGFVMAEGAGALILETLEHARRRGARIYAEIIGYGSTADAHHITQPAPGGEGGARAMEAALADAGIDPTDVDYINAHGTSTPQGDVAETLAIKRVFGDHAYRLAVSSTKSMTGHLLGAAGAVEAILTVLALRDGVLPPTINLDDPDPECDLDYVPHRARPRAIRVALSNSFGFGGQNACLAFRRYDAGAEDRGA
ncbi:beta-ketoacyl-[acyl-carrier-protein] synthase II [Thermaerobacter sp. FW80]|uniref:beta-ketoacyl-ACP synthase II n=1 Tax=Thermaerobacter sp. FW80 TaxID=2546351 RepID=UPI001074E746|nr:beta-ketoacyl-ACP synthase II [Thermaerobacter sp. FW80]QBS37790.1 beta-ketoacyl-[acyl-carrier-protein] synthase II [Thermaerobacter sp. FW80]